MGVFKRIFGGRTPGTEQEAMSDMSEAVRLFRQGSFTEALAISDRLIALGPTIALSWRFRGECLVALQRHDEAVDAFDKASGLGGPGTDDLFLWSSLALHNGGKPEQAKERLREALASTQLTPELRARTQAALQTLEQRSA